MNELIKKSSLSGSHLRLVELMQRVDFGRIEQLMVRNGEPIFDPAPKVIKKVRIGGVKGPRPELSCEDFQLKKQTVELLRAITDLGEGMVLTIAVAHGLPFGMEIEIR